VKNVIFHKWTASAGLYFQYFPPRLLSLLLPCPPVLLLLLSPYLLVLLATALSLPLVYLGVLYHNLGEKDTMLSFASETSRPEIE